MEEGEQRARQAEIGKVFLIDRGERTFVLNLSVDDMLSCFFFLSSLTLSLSLQMWTSSLLCAHRSSTRDSLMIYLESNVVSIDAACGESVWLQNCLCRCLITASVLQDVWSLDLMLPPLTKV